MAFFNTQEVSSPVGVKDEGVVITGSVASLDFVGAGVSTAIAGGITTVTIPGPTSIALNDLNDTTITSAASGEILSYNGSAWVNTAVLTGITSLNGLVITANTGTITTGIWSGTTIGVNKGGTGGSNAGIGLFNNITGYTASGATGTTSTNLVFSTSPTLVTPVLGVATATTLNGMTITTSTGTFTLTNSKTLTVSDSTTLAINSITLAGGEVITFTASNALSLLTTGATVMTFPAVTDTVVTLAATQTLTNKRRTRRAVSTTQSATPTINTDNGDVFVITGLAQAITSFTTNLSGTPVAEDLMEISITDDGTGRALTFGASFAATTVALPTTTVASTRLRVYFQWSAVTSKWECIGTA